MVGLKASATSHCKGITLMQMMDMFPDESTAVRWFEAQVWGTMGPLLRALRQRRDQGGSERQADALFVPRLPLLLQRPHGHSAGPFASHHPQVGHRRLHSQHEPQGRVQHEAAPRLGRYPADGGVHAAPAPQGVGIGVRGHLWRARRDGRDLHRGQAQEHAEAEREGLTGHYAVGKAPIVGIKDRGSNRVAATPMPSVNQESVEQIVAAEISDGAKVYTDERSVHNKVDNHEAVNHSSGEYVRGEAHVNGMESFWSIFKGGYIGTYHRMSPKHLHRYVTGFTGRHNVRDQDAHRPNDRNGRRTRRQAADVQGIGGVGVELAEQILIASMTFMVGTMIVLPLITSQFRD